MVIEILCLRSCSGREIPQLSFELEGLRISITSSAGFLVKSPNRHTLSPMGSPEPRSEIEAFCHPLSLSGSAASNPRGLGQLGAGLQRWSEQVRPLAIPPCSTHPTAATSKLRRVGINTWLTIIGATPLCRTASRLTRRPGSPWREQPGLTPPRRQYESRRC